MKRIVSGMAASASGKTSSAGTVHWARASSLWLVALWGWLAVATAAAEVGDLTPSQQEMLQNLPAEQRDDVLQRMQERERDDDDDEAVDRYELEETDRVDPEEMRERYAEPSAIEQRLQRRLGAARDAEEAHRFDIEQDLYQFGYDLFSGEASFPAAANIPVPARYTIGPGDVLEVNFYGQQTGSHTLGVNAEGQIHFPEVGPVSVAGKSFEEVRELIDETVDEHFVGVNVAVSIGELRAMQIFVTGDVFQPGSYTVSSLATLSNALLSSGGVRRIGSLRNVQLKRDGETVTTFDLYDLLLEGDISADVRLQDGDVVHVPSIGPTVAVGGEVTRPAIYELRHDLTAERLLEMAGGTTPEADAGYAEISRRTEDGYKTVAELDLREPEDLEKQLRDGDVLRVYEAPEMAESLVTLRGHARRPGSVEWREGLQVTDVVESVERDLMPNPDVDYAVIARESGPERSLETFSFDLGAALDDPDGEANVELKPRDQIFVFGTTEGDRAEALQPLINRLRAQSRHAEPPEIAAIRGHVRHPGFYPWEEGMRIDDLIRAGWDLQAEADYDYAILARQKGPDRRVEVETVDLGEALADPESDANRELTRGDQLFVFGLEEDRADTLEPLINRLLFQGRHNQPPPVAEVQGHVRYPGSYPLSEGMRVRDLITASLDIRSNTDLDYALVQRSGVERGTRSIRLRNILQDPDHEENFELRPGDRLLVFTDGTIEADDDEPEATESTEEGGDAGATSERPEISEDEVAAVAQEEGVSQEEAARMIAAEEGVDADPYADISEQDVVERAESEGISEEEAARQLMDERDQERQEAAADEEATAEAEEDEPVYDPTDEITSRRSLIDPLIEDLQRQARHGQPAAIVRVTGSVRVTGEYPLEQEMRVSDLIRAANGLEESAYALRGELTRYRVIDGEYREVGHHPINLADALAGDPDADLRLEPHDRLRIKQIPGWDQQYEVELAGEVRFPGTYSVRPGETMTELLERAGGLTERAYPRGAVFTRERLREQEAQRMERMTQRLQRDIATLRLREGEDLEGFQQLQELLVGIAEADAVGRLAIDLPAILAERRADVTLKDGDQLVIPDEPQEVTVMGEVQQPTSHLHQPGMTREDYIERSGGTTRLADANRAFVVHANGEVSGRSASRWFARAAPVEPGDTIIVPFNPDRMSALELVGDVSSIFYQLGVAVAAWDTVGVFD